MIFARNKEQFAFRYRRLISALFGFLFLTTAFAARAGSPGYPVAEFKVFEQSNRTEIKTPSGTKLIVGDWGDDGTSRYRVDVLLADMTPKPTAAPTGGGPTPVPLMPAMSSPSPTPTLLPMPTPTPTATPTPVPKRNAASTTFYDDSDYLILKANHLFNRRNYLEATEYVDELLRRRPDHVRGWVMKGSLMWVQGQKDLAKKSWEQALALEPDSDEIQRLLQRFK